MFRPCTIGDFVEAGVADIQTGPFGTQLKASEYVSEGVPVINVRNIGYSDLRAEKLEFVTEGKAEKLSVHRIKPDDIVFGRKGAVDRHLFVRADQDDWVQGSDCIRLRIKSEEINPRFISYALLTEQHKKWMLNQCGNKATMASLNQDVVKRIPLQLPDPGVQNDIASRLSAYDDLIENNRRRIALLEEAARQLYKEWFVRFRFPGHEHVKLIDGVPEGWSTKSPHKYFETEIGGGWGFDEPEGQFSNPAYVIRGTDMPGLKNGGSGGAGIRFDKESKLEKRYLDHGDIVFEVSGGSSTQPIARTLLITSSFLDRFSEKVIPASFCKKIRLKSWADAVFFHFHTQHSRDVGKILEYQKESASSLKNFDWKGFLSSYNIMLPSKTLRQRFADEVEGLLHLQENLAKQCDSAQKARDLFLPKLMNGTLTV